MEAWADLESVVRTGVVKARGGTEEQIEVIWAFSTDRFLQWSLRQVWEGATAAEVGERVAGFLEKKAVGKAVALMEAAKEAFDDDDLFGNLPREEMMEQDEEEDEAGEEETRALESLMKRLKLVFLR